MKITLTELRRIIRNVVKECYGWPVESEKPLYNVRSRMGQPSEHDPKNSALRFPKGKNTRSRVNESFSKISRRELEEWHKGNWGYIHESDKVDEMCSQCGGMKTEEEATNECDCG
jgi:hypothetical protein